MTKRLWIVSLLLVLLLAYGFWVYRKPLPLIKPDHASLKLQISSPSPNLSWPAYGQAAVGRVGYSSVDSYGAQTPMPTASIAKIISALCVLQQKPLQPGQQGPTITLTTADADIYDNYVAQDGSVVPVSVGEQISEYQLLEAMMLPSANNAADSLVDWAFGSLPAYADYANNWLRGQGLTQTHVGSDASGFSPTTTSTASDLVKLGELAMREPVLSQIVGLSSAELPAAGTIHNVNFLLGSNNIVGIKTGNNDQDKGAFLSASTKSINGHNLTIVTAVINAPDLWQAMHDSATLIKSAQTNFTDATVISKDAVVGDYHLPWGGVVQAVASQTMQVPIWRGDNLTAEIKLQAIRSAKAHQVVGGIVADKSALSSQQTVSVELNQDISKPSFWWRLLHPLK